MTGLYDMIVEFFANILGEDSSFYSTLISFLDTIFGMIEDEQSKLEEV